ncbi:hypothetical protein NEUTE1DRAFT_118346 [Neurospora tetrasperma FGSC 2508]|uniref:Uncharacterized protein n=1 Tax=Neurospora tetrasperma (strain FGSC 2508 / ATCC MYA-4615 / P0657) TaxID=510951 RepID=F8MWC5_NEUT8|nr:uncharacterized protein NEUTE1DRAFT_118346 [Neurospora tetrasperma FGSC 2508]EGO54920.1 hypothetical protein NEUTE1DRAFT_118346 [Neurospora tetrasperma FGSC 2508]EGZ67588.1 hypothetical protein NEUTE2DRAFT_145687 [Neurospora tetrasperma FGSC 2509]
MDMMWLSEYVGRVTVCDWIAVGAARDSVTAKAFYHTFDGLGGALSALLLPSSRY